MAQLNWNSQGGPLLLAFMLTGYLYILPAILAFMRGHQHFWAILVLNILVAPVQIFLFHAIAPSLFIVAHVPPLAVLTKSFTVAMGPGWLLMLAWSLAPVPQPRPGLIAARNTKIFDFVAALPLILWFGYGVFQLRPILTNDGSQILAGHASLFVWVQFFGLFMAALSSLICIYLLVVRGKPVLKSRGAMPRFFGVLGTFLGVGILQLPVVTLSLPAQMVAALLIAIGSTGEIFVLVQLGKSFSILPEARVLVTGGPYSYARHPLYTMELISLTGTAMLFHQPQAFILFVAVLALLVIRSIFEERVLTEAYPAYRAYRTQTKRFIPGVI